MQKNQKYDQYNKYASFRDTREDTYLKTWVKNVLG